mgnify:CR=1 FL=1
MAGHLAPEEWTELVADESVEEPPRRHALLDEPGRYVQYVVYEATGTPAGCALSIPSPAKQKIGALLPERKKWDIFFKVQSQRTQYLKAGQVVEASIRSALREENSATQEPRVSTP